jgi:hypothetical protein
MCLSNSYKVKNNNLLHKIFLWQHVSTVVGNHQAFQRTDGTYQKFLIHWICSLEGLIMTQKSRKIIRIEIQQDATVYKFFLFHIYMKLNMFRATYRLSSGA